MSIGEHIYNGMGAAAWLLGFLILFAGTLIALFLIVYGVMLIAKAGGEASNRKEVASRAGTHANRFQPYGHAPTVGRHMRKGL